MPRVPEYHPNVSLRPAFRQDVDVRATPEAFGAGAGRGMQGLARGLSEVGAALAQVQELEDSLRAKEADNAFADWMRERMYGEGGFMTLEGRNAVDGRAAFEREAAEKRREFGKGLTGGAARAYHSASQARLQSAYQQSIIHTAQARKTWFKDASNARVETFANDALVSYNRPDLVAKNIAAGVLELREQGRMHGWDDDTLKLREAEFVSGVHKNITLRIAQDDPLAAEKYMKDNADRLTGAHRFELNKALENEIAQEHAKREADAILKEGRKPHHSSGEPGGSRSVGATDPTSARAFLLGRLSKGHDKSHIDGLDESFAANLAAMIQDAPPEIRDGLGVLSGYRSPDRQRELFAAAVKKYGSEAAARKWVAPPGRSFHNHGQAVDLAYNGRSLAHAPKEVVEWVHRNAGKYGLYFPMSHEPWHVEPVGTRSGTVAPRGSMVAPRTAMPSPVDIEARLDRISDPKVRDLTRKRIYAAIEAQNKAYEMEAKAARAELWRYIDQGATPDQVPMEVRQAAGMAAVSAAWGYLETVRKGRAVESDETLLYDMRRYAAIDPIGFAEIDLNDYRDRLSIEAIKELTGKQTDALNDQRKAREEGLNLTAAFSQAQSQLEAVGITTTGKRGSEREAAAQRIARFQNALAEEMEAFRRRNKGQAPTQLDIQSMVNKLLLPIVIKTPGWLWDSTDSSKRLFEAGDRADGSTVDVDVQYSDIPIDLRRGIVIDLERELGRKPSEAEVVQRYEDFILGRDLPTREDEIRSMHARQGGAAAR
jgi:hypothetical protein